MDIYAMKTLKDIAKCLRVIALVITKAEITDQDIQEVKNIEIEQDYKTLISEEYDRYNHQD